MPRPRHHRRGEVVGPQQSLAAAGRLRHRLRIPRPGENPARPLIVAAKHQSMWETFALLPLFDDPVFIVKRELMWIPIFGWCMWKGGMIPVDRGAGSQALAAMTERARAELADGRQIIIFPGRHAPAARRRAAIQIRRRASLCRDRRALRADRAQFRPVLAAPLVPPLSRHDRGRVLDPIAPGLDKDAFFKRLQDDIEAATARLIAEGSAELKRRMRGRGYRRGRASRATPLSRSASGCKSASRSRALRAP